MCKYIYNRESGYIMAKLPISSNISDVYDNDLNIDYLVFDKEILNWQEFKIIDGKFIEYSPLEKDELVVFGKILSQTERTLYKLTPNHDEVKKAENTIEILTLLSEVL